MAGSADHQEINVEFVRQIDNGSHGMAGQNVGLKLYAMLFRHPACLLKDAVEASRGDPGLLPNLLDIFRQIRDLFHAHHVERRGTLL